MPLCVCDGTHNVGLLKSYSEAWCGPLAYCQNKHLGRTVPGKGFQRSV